MLLCQKGVGRARRPWMSRAVRCCALCAVRWRGIGSMEGQHRALPRLAALASAAAAKVHSAVTHRHPTFTHNRVSRSTGMPAPTSNTSLRQIFACRVDLLQQNCAPPSPKSLWQAASPTASHSRTTAGPHGPFPCSTSHSTQHAPLPLTQRRWPLRQVRGCPRRRG